MRFLISESPLCRSRDRKRERKEKSKSPPPRERKPKKKSNWDAPPEVRLIPKFYTYA